MTTPTPDADEPMVSQDDLDRLCATAEQRFMASLRTRPDHAEATYRELEAARRATTNRYLDWIALTDEYLLGQLGHGAHRQLTEVERTAELAVRSSLTLEDLKLIQQLCGAAENPVSARMSSALKASDASAVLRTWRESERLLKAAHDFRCDLLSDRLGRIYRRFGVAALEEAMLYAAPRGTWRSMPADLALPPRERLTNLAFFLTVCAYFQLRIVEEPECWVVNALVCGRCGRQCRDRYYTSGWGLEIVTDRGPVTFGLEAMTIYQTHLAVIHGTYAIDTLGAPWPVFECRGVRADPGGCRLSVYKDPSQTPARFYEQLGRRRPDDRERSATTGNTVEAH